MKKFKKLFLSAAMLSALCALGGGLTSNAEDATEPSTPEVPSLTENFSFAEEFDYGDGTIDAYGGANNHNIYANNKQALISTKLEKKDDLEVLTINTLKDGSQSGKISFRDNAAAPNLYNKEGGAMVLKFKFNIDHGREQQFGLYFHANDGLGAAKSYELLRMRDNGTFYRVKAGDNSAWIQITTLKDRVTKNAWHEATFILQDKGDLLPDGKSQDKIIGFLDGQFIYETNFGDGDNFQGKLTEFFYNLPTSNTSADINAYIDYIRIGDYNAPVATAPTVEDVKVSIPFDLEPTITGSDSNYLPSVVPGYTIDFSLNDTKLTSSTENGVTVYKSGEEAIIQCENGKYVGLKTVENLKATFTFDADFINPVDVTFDVAENRDPIPVTDITTDKVVINDTITLGVGESFDLSKIFKAYPTTADDITLEYTNSDDTVVGLDNYILTGVATGTAKVTVTALGGENVTKEITVVVTKGVYDALNGYTLEDVWDEPNKTLHGYTSKTHNNKQYSHTNVVADDLFGLAIKIAGTGGANQGGSHLDLHLPLANLTANKDYKLTGWVKMDITAASPTGRIDFKLYNYFDAGKGNYGYSPMSAPYYVIKQNEIGETKNGWVYVETGPINFDPNALDRDYIGLKIELGTWNTQTGVDAYITHLNLVELDDVKTTGWEITDSSNKIIATDNAITQKVGSTYQINAVAVPSAGVVNATYASSDETIATVDASGLVTFLDKSGNVTITITNGDVKKTVSFVVNKPATEVTVDASVELSLGDVFKELNITVTPADATSILSAEVADDTICAVDITGGKLQIVPMAIGSTTITILVSDNPSLTKTVTVVVKGYTVTFDVKGHGTAPEKVENVTQLPAELTSLTAEGWIFGGWFLDEDCTQAAEANAAIEANVTLYAKWTAEAPTTFTVTYNVNGHGTAPAKAENVTALPQTLPTVTAEGYTFDGWYVDAECTTKATAGAELTSDVTLYAKWTKVPTETPGEGDTTPTPTPDTPKDSSVNVVAIVVPIVVVVVLAVAGVLVYFFVFKKKEPKDKE